MVYESDFYTIRRPYSTRVTPSVSSYSVSTVPTQITKYLSGAGKVYVVNTSPRNLIPYVGHKRLTYYTPTQIIRVRPSIYYKELDRIEHKYRPSSTYSYLNDYLSSSSATKHLTQTFDDEKRAIRAQSNAILQRIHSPVPKVTVRVLPYSSRYTSPIRISPESYIQSLVTPVRRVADNILNISYYSEPAKRFLGPGHLACIRFAGDKAYSKRSHMSDLTDHVIRNDINLLSYYLKNRQAANVGGIEKPIKVIGLSSVRPSRVFSAVKPLPDPADEKREVEELKAAQKAATLEGDDSAAKLREKRRAQEAEKAAEERALAEERARQKEQAKKEEEARRAELQRQAELEKQRLLEEEAEREAQRIEKARKEAEEKLAAEQAEAERLAEEERLEAERKAEEERLEAERKAEEERQEAERKAEEERLEAERKAEEERLEAERKAEEAKLEEERRQAELQRLDEIAQQAEEASLQRQAEELAELARQEAELAKKEQEEAEADQAEAEDNIGAGAESADEQADIPNEESAPADEPEPVVEEPETPEATQPDEEPAAPTAEEVVEDEAEEEEEEEE
ncbi:uncharacterized abhydrolase domain-containing protein DDB_G0269086 isoform X5 [Chrysoperla carnea]|uniref:uncharacterized abhydrolase domain-containing protein DDB_G0269086 isoform X5 n=1 Tax=Chrysoperla carnea TaxID=189513 RepID=UPI001D0840DC|nr:uncharacterized abhydrolase domain-containing protein DDB_G0269086 isoform X5 [Chrysoperla carnea]